MKLGKKTLITRRTSLTRRAVISTVPYMSNTAYLVASPIMGPWSVPWRGNQFQYLTLLHGINGEMFKGLYDGIDIT
jgi:hypothetical protein